MRKVGFPLFILCLAFAVLLVSSVSASGNLITPATSGTVSGARSPLNATNVTGAVNLTDMLNCSFYAKSASTANSSFVLIAVQLNDTPLQPSINASFDSKILEDSNDYVFNASCSNATTVISSLSTGITVDNTSPDTPTSFSPASYTTVTTTDTQTFSASVNNTETTGCTYTISRGGTASGDDLVSGTATYSASTCSFTKAFSSTDNGVWVWKITASDGTQSAVGGAEVNIQLPASGGGLPSANVRNVNGQVVQNNSKSWIVIVILAIVIIGGVIVLARRK